MKCQNCNKTLKEFEETEFCQKCLNDIFISEELDDFDEDLDELDFFDEY